jgi:hypothetical protein
MHPEQERQSQRVEDRIQEFDEDLGLLNWQITKIEARLRAALEQVNMIDLSPP